MADPIASVESLTLDLPPSCIEFCPAHPDYFCVGTYNLEKDEARARGDTSRPQNRNGSIVLFKVEDKKVHHLQTTTQPSAILDLHFQQAEGRHSIFSVASSTATLSIFRLAPSAASGNKVEPISVVRIDGIGDDVLFLSCAWHPSIPDLVAVSTSTGSIYVIALDQTQQPCAVTKSSVLTHELEAWTVAFSPFTRKAALLESMDSEKEGSRGAGVVASGRDSQDVDSRGPIAITLYSGGDDSSLRYTSCVLNTRPSTSDDSLLQAPYGICKLSGHEAGVTAILPVSLTNADGGHIVVTGSYDDRIRVYSIFDPVDTGGVRRTMCLADQNLGGGVWRLKLINQTVGDGGRWSLRVLASCMHSGVRVVDIIGDVSGDCHISVAARFEEHNSMNYGSDFKPKSPLLCVSTSFYDKLLCLWEVDDRQGQK